MVDSSILLSLCVFVAALTSLYVNIPTDGSKFIPANNTTSDLNNYPIIGILAQPPEGDDCPSDKTYDTYIAASYVKFAEMAGIRVVPIPYDIAQDKLVTLLDQLNGVLFPGGGTMLIQGDKYTPYFSVESFIFETAKQKNDAGIHFPLLGTCLGFQSMALLAMDPTRQTLDICDTEERVFNQTLVNRDTTRTYADLPDNLVQAVENEMITYENHNGCVTIDHMNQDTAFSSFYAVTAQAVDRKGVEYINSMEAKDYPFYAFQFHTEKNIFEWTTQTAIPHSMEAVEFTQYLGDVFGSEVRLNQQKFASQDDEIAALIYNYQAMYRHSYFEQTYCFDKPE